MDARISVCLKHHEPLSVGRAYSELGAIRSCSWTGHSSASKYSHFVLGKIYEKAARFELRFTRSGVFWWGAFYDIGNCQDASFLEVRVSLERKWENLYFLNSHLETPSCGRVWKVCLLKAERSKPDAETSSAWRQREVFAFLSSRTCFGISALGLEFGFKAPPCGRGSLLWSQPYCFTPEARFYSISSMMFLTFLRKRENR